MPLSKIDSDSLNSPITAVNLAYTGTLTGGTGVVNLGSGQVYKDASGNVGVGVVPSASWGTYKVIQLGEQGVLSGFATGAGVLNIGANFYWDGSGYKYLTTNPATLYQQNAGAHNWRVAASGTADAAISFNAAMTLDASGNLQLTSGGTWATSAGGLQLSMNNNDGYITTYYDTHTVTLGAGVSAKNQIKVSGAGGANNITFSVAGSERARITASGKLLVNTTAESGSNDSVVTIKGTGATGLVRCLALETFVTASIIVQTFRNPNGQVGYIATDASSTQYSTSSDYRLKEAIAPMTGALAKVALLKPCTYKWKVDGSDGQGFIAHELAEVEAGCVTGEKDAVDADGNPKYQGIDTSFLVATLTAAIQELKAIVDAQGAEIAALKGTP